MAITLIGSPKKVAEINHSDLGNRGDHYQQESSFRKLGKVYYEKVSDEELEILLDEMDNGTGVKRLQKIIDESEQVIRRRKEQAIELAKKMLKAIKES